MTTRPLSPLTMLLSRHTRRRAFISLLGGAAAAWPLVARAQQGEQMRRIGVLIAGLTEKDSEGQLRMAAFRQGLQNLGWVEGRNIHIEERPLGVRRRCQMGRGAQGNSAAYTPHWSHLRSCNRHAAAASGS